MDNFEEIVGELKDLDPYIAVDVKLAKDASLSAGFLFHEGDCDCEQEVVVICFKLFGGEGDVNIAILPNTPLYKAIMDGRFEARFKKRVAEGA